MIVSDDQCWTDYGFMGHPHIRTPHLDRLARESLTFRRGYVPSSLCSPSLASLITGRYPHQHLITGNDPFIPVGLRAKEFYASPAFAEGRELMNQRLGTLPLLPKLLADGGYVSLQTGKWWQGHFSNAGFTDGMTKGGRHGDEGLAIGRKTMAPIEDFVRKAKAEGKPFFVWYAPLLPHDPHKPPDRLLARYRATAPSIHVARYWAMCEWMDETCGQLLGFLEREGLAENTIVTFLADNGWIQDPTSIRYAAMSKQSPYDGGLRTPVIVKWPQRIKPGVSDIPVSSLDLFPTLLSACGIQVPPGLPGIDLTDTRALGQRNALFGECFTHNILNLEKPSENLRWRWILSDGWKLIVPTPPNESGDPELYRMDSDPNETKDLAATHPERVDELRQRLDTWWRP